MEKDILFLASSWFSSIIQNQYECCSFGYDDYSRSLFLDGNAPYPQSQVLLVYNELCIIGKCTPGRGN